MSGLRRAPPQVNFSLNLELLSGQGPQPVPVDGKELRSEPIDV